MSKHSKICIPEFEPMSRDEHWRMKAGMGRPLTSRKSPCDSCAVVWEFYKDLSDELKQQPRRVQIACAKRWFCHDDPSKSCKGNWDNLKASEKKQEKEEKAKRDDN